MKALAFIVTALLLVSCEYRYRYECQDPEMWGEKQCQRPDCEATGTCPDQLLGREITQGKIDAAEESSPAPDCNNDMTEVTGE